MMTGKYKISVGAVTAVLVLIGTIIGGLWAAERKLDQEYAKRSDVRKLEAQITKGLDEVLDSIENLACSNIRAELNNIALKEANEDLTEYDKARRNDLELQWQRKCLDRGDRV